MAVRRPVNQAASVRARLLNASRERGIEFQRLLSDFAIERLLYRLGASPHADGFVLKGATLFKLWSDDRRRATWDLDLLGRRQTNVSEVVSIMRDLCASSNDDGIVFDSRSIRGEDIQASDEYVGVRIRLEAKLAEAVIPMQVDVGFGDAVVVPVVRELYPTLLGHDAPRILVYPRESVVAEKLEAMLSLGVTNSRMKDFYDVHYLAASFSFEGVPLVDAIRATFDRRGTVIPASEPLVLTREFLGAPERRTLWRAFLRRSRLDGPEEPEALADALVGFAGPVLRAVAQGHAFADTWPPGGPWQPPSLLRGPGVGGRGLE